MQMISCDVCQNVVKADGINDAKTFYFYTDEADAHGSKIGIVLKIEDENRHICQECKSSLGQWAKQRAPQTRGNALFVASQKI